MRFGTTRSQIYDAQKSAQAHWFAATEEWNDSAQREHSEQIWEPLDQIVSEALRAIDQLSVLFTQVRNECDSSGGR